MTRDEMQAIHDKYHEAFGDGLRGPSLAHGHVNVPDDEFYAIARSAIARGKPIDWTEHYPLLPENCVS